MTEYEKRVAAGTLQAMSGLDAVMIGAFSEQIINNGQCENDDKEAVKGCWTEIEYLFNERLDELEILRKIIYE